MIAGQGVVAMKIGIMGGTLDPVHNGHIQIALQARRMLGLERVMLLPAGDPPHKAHPTGKADRLNMARIAAESVEGLYVSGLEIEREGTTFTVDTLRELTQREPDTQWYYLIGADTLDVLESWRNIEEVAGMCAFAVIGRADEAVDMDHVHALERQYGARFEVLPFHGPDISSTQIRERVAAGEEIADLVPPGVAAYIRAHGLYLANRSREEICTALQATLKPARYTHTLGVAETAKRLAPRYGVDPVRAELAGLLHDCAKYMPIDEMRKLVRGVVPDVDAEELETVSVLHAPAGAVWAAREFGVRDRGILSAIRKHTLGDARMSALDALIYTADFIEPNRTPFPGLEEARSLAETDVFAATRRCAELTNRHLAEQGRQAHPRTLRMLAEL